MKVWDRRSSLPVAFEGHTGWVGRFWYRRDGVVSSPRRCATGRPGRDHEGVGPEHGRVVPTLAGDRTRNSVTITSALLVPLRISSRPPPVTSPDGQRIVRVWAGSGGSAGDRSQQGLCEQFGPGPRRRRPAASSTRWSATPRMWSASLFSPDGRRIATASSDRTIKLWDTATGREVFTLRGTPPGCGRGLQPDGRRLVSGSIDFTARVWDATPGRGSPSTSTTLAIGGSSRPPSSDLPHRPRDPARMAKLYATRGPAEKIGPRTPSARPSVGEAGRPAPPARPRPVPPPACGDIAGFGGPPRGSSSRGSARPPLGRRPRQ